MIDEYWTWIFYGYHSDELKPQSNKIIVAVCDECGKYRDVRKYAYRELCKSCSVKKRYEDPVERDKTSAANRKRYEDPAERDKTSVAGKKHHDDHPDTREKMSIAQKKHYEDHPDRRERQSATGKRRYEDPLEREKSSIVHKKYYEDNPDTLEKISIVQKKHYEDHPDRREKASIRMSAEKNPNWKGGITPWRNALLRTPSYKSWRKAVFERDNYTCKMCNERGVYLEAHHILPIRDNKNTLLIFDINNGITLCKGCHNETKGKEYEFIEQFKAIIGGTR